MACKRILLAASAFAFVNHATPQTNTTAAAATNGSDDSDTIFFLNIGSSFLLPSARHTIYASIVPKSIQLETLSKTKILWTKYPMISPVKRLFSATEKLIVRHNV